MRGGLSGPFLFGQLVGIETPSAFSSAAALCVGLIAGSPLGASSGTLALLLDQFHPDLGMVVSRGATREAGRIKGFFLWLSRFGVRAPAGDLFSETRGGPSGPFLFGQLVGIETPSAFRPERKRSESGMQAPRCSWAKCQGQIQSRRRLSRRKRSLGSKRTAMLARTFDANAEEYWVVWDRSIVVAARDPQLDA